MRAGATSPVVADPVHELVDLRAHAPELRFDVRYARADNFIGRAVYPEPAAFAQRPVAESLRRVHARLEASGVGLLIFDGYRPWSVTKIFWDETPEPRRVFVANPETGSIHNRGCAVDLSLFSLASGKAIEMPSDFDEMNEKAYADYAGGSVEARRFRDLLKTVMEAEGFQGYRFEWWHFNHESMVRYPVMDLTFDQVRASFSKNRV